MYSEIALQCTVKISACQFELFLCCKCNVEMETNSIYPRVAAAPVKEELL